MYNNVLHVEREFSDHAPSTARKARKYSLHLCQLGAKNVVGLANIELPNKRLRQPNYRKAAKHTPAAVVAYTRTSFRGNSFGGRTHLRPGIGLRTPR